MRLNIIERRSGGKGPKKIYYYFAWGWAAGQRNATGIFTYAEPKNKLQENHNEKALVILENRKSQMLLDQKAMATGGSPIENFLNYYAEFVENNKQKNNRHMEASFVQFKAFLKKDFLTANEVTEDLCYKFRQYLFDNFNGETQISYFGRFKRMIKAATKEGYLEFNVAADLSVKRIKKIERKEYSKIDLMAAVNKLPNPTNWKASPAGRQEKR